VLQEVLGQQKAAPSHAEVDIDDLLDDPDLEKLHAERLAQLRQEAEKRMKLQQKGHGAWQRERLAWQGTGAAPHSVESERVVAHSSGGVGCHRKHFVCQRSMPANQLPAQQEMHRAWEVPCWTPLLPAWPWACVTPCPGTALAVPDGCGTSPKWS
jgi:hypothetical protein